ncbi:Glutathione S-transferase U17 [Hibiscus syriacus]|uniref:Glutathione S-transferase n=1 Tax=Hibiscus syriacus TaxID=106335 RepID=A0A6A3B4U9_HIBSY|nr:glutathione S-transferase U17-like [Hibiscus syriacus]KAE8711816.1 Glutathione S-transferase U17 [Hibiscus syriacus]
MATGEVKVLSYWVSPFVMRTRIAFNIKCVKYELVGVNILEAKSELLLRSNPVHKRVPVLIHGHHQPICESLIIMQYIDDTWSSGPSILPSNPKERALVQFWAAYLDEKWFPAMKSILAHGEESTIAKLGEGLALMEETIKKCSKGKAFFGGDEIGYLDIAFGSLLGCLRVTEMLNGMKLLDEPNTPTLVSWADRFCSHAAVKDVMPHTHKIAKFF